MPKNGGKAGFGIAVDQNVVMAATLCRLTCGWKVLCWCRMSGRKQCQRSESFVNVTTYASEFIVVLLGMIAI
jgi:hypothetical protein